MERVVNFISGAIPYQLKSYIEESEFDDTMITFVANGFHFVVIIKDDSLSLLEVEIAPMYQGNGLCQSIIHILKVASEKYGYTRFSILSIYNPIIHHIADKMGMQYHGKNTRYILLR